MLAAVGFIAGADNGQIVFQFEQQGGNTVVTGSGTEMTGTAGVGPRLELDSERSVRVDHEGVFFRSDAARSTTPR